MLVSLDGFRWDYLDRGLTPALSRLAADGVRARALVPVFPTTTFPNHYTLVTGLTAGRHGIVGNRFSAPDVGRGFSMYDRTTVRDARFWQGEPIWVTAERQGFRTAIYFWPGSEAPIGGVRPTWWMPYDHDTPDTARVHQVLDWLALPPSHRPSLVTLYLSVVDQAGHDFGPDSPETDSAIVRADRVVGMLVDALALRAGTVNLLVVSDHGMAATSPQRVVWLDDYVKRNWLEIDALSPVLMARPVPGKEDSLVAGLRRAARLTVYRRGELPARYHLGSTPRVAPVVALADEGWSIAWRPGPGRPPAQGSRGDHGFDNALASMAAVFVARGPAFRRGAEAPAFGNVHVYALLAELLGVRPAATEGSLDSVRAMLAASDSSAPRRPRGSPRAPAAPARSFGGRAPR